MSKVSIELYANDEIAESFVAKIPEDKVDWVKLQFINLMSEVIYKYEIEEDN